MDIVTTKNAGIGISEYSSLYTNQTPYHVNSSKKRYPAASQSAQVALTAITYLKSVFLCRF